MFAVERNPPARAAYLVVSVGGRGYRPCFTSIRLTGEGRATTPFSSARSQRWGIVGNRSRTGSLDRPRSHKCSGSLARLSPKSQKLREPSCCTICRRRLCVGVSPPLLRPGKIQHINCGLSRLGRDAVGGESFLKVFRGLWIHDF